MHRNLSSVRIFAIALGLVGLLSLAGTRAALAGGVVGNGTPGSCTQTAFDTKVQMGGMVTFNCGANPKTITLTFYEQISHDVTIDGGGKITLKASNTAHFQVFDGYALTLKNIALTNANSIAQGSIDNHGTLTMQNVTVKGNTAPLDTGAVTNYGIATIKNSTFMANNAQYGAAIYNAGGTLKVISSTFDSNSSGRGGAIYNYSGPVTIKSSTFTANKATSDNGGAIYADAGTVTIKNSTFTSNTAAGDGGAIMNNAVPLTITKSKFIKNSAYNAGALENNRTANITGSTFDQNKATNLGGAILDYDTTQIVTSTISNNQAGSGGGVFSYNSGFDLQQSTVNGNTAANDGGGVYIFYGGHLVNDTISANHAGSGGGGGIFQHTGKAIIHFLTIVGNTAQYGAGINNDGATSGNAYLGNTVLSGNTGGNCAGVVSSVGYNLSSDSYCGGFFQTGDKNSKNAKLGPLANNGGPTLTHKPLAGSPLLNKGTLIGTVNVDQRGVARPQQHAKFDIGSVEVQ